MTNKNFKILFDARFLGAGINKTSARAGIYFTTLNILKSLLKREDIKITLYTSTKEKNDVKALLKQEFPNTKFDIIVFNEESVKSKIDTLFYIASQDKNFISKFFFKLWFYALYYIKTSIVNFNILFYGIISRGFSAIFSSAFYIPTIISRLFKTKKFVLLHDVIPIILFKYYGHNPGNKWFFDLIETFNKNDYYFANSEFTRQDFLKYFPQIDPKKITTTYIGCNIEKNENLNNLDKIKTKYDIPKDKKYLFSLCTLEPRKNLMRIVKTFIKFVEKNNINDLILVLGGGSSTVFKQQLDKEITNFYENKILQIGYVDDEDLPVLYGGAEWFTFTSEYEGFGLPVLEAMKCGCPVITSNSTSLPEVVGEAGIKIDWDSDEQHIQAYEKYYFDENLRQENSAKGIEQAKLFTWDKTVDKMANIMFGE